MTYAQTVTGRIPAEKMGFTLLHEHVFWDLSFSLPKDLDKTDEMLAKAYEQGVNYFDTAPYFPPAIVSF